jgi:tRNA dimethylallyltransferase
VPGRLIAIVGPTASGKSALAMRIAAELPCEIVSCDSLQVYRGLDIGSAKPTPAERQAVPHHLIDVVDPDQDFSAAEYAARARAAVGEIERRGRLPLVVGGTGLYLRALLQGLFEGPSRDAALRRRFDALARRHGDRRLHRLLARVDPEAAARTATRDRVRVIRALEVYWATGRPISDHRRRATSALQGFSTFAVGLSPPRDRLRETVAARVDAMLEGGLLDEIRGLLGQGFSGELRPMQAIGYRQGVEVVQGRLEPGKAPEAIVTATMRYAKRQMTWFRHQLDVCWHEDAERALQSVRDWLRVPPSR